VLPVLLKKKERLEPKYTGSNYRQFEKIRLADGKGTFQNKDSKMKRLVEIRNVHYLYFKSGNRSILLSGCNKQLSR
jgi:hypothetical protein